MKKIIKINLIILVIFCLSFNSAFNIVKATSETDESEETSEENHDEQVDEVIEEPVEEKKTLDDLQLEKSELESGIEESNAQIGFIETQLSKNVVEIAQIEQEVLDKELEIKTLEAEEANLLKYVNKAEKELEESEKKYNSRRKLLEKRIVAIYEMGQVSYLDVLLNSKSFFDLVSNYFLLEEIASADTDLLEEVKAERKYNRDLKSALDAKKSLIVAYRDTRQRNTVALENMAILKRTKIAALSEEEQELFAMVEEYQKQIADIETEIRLLAIANVGADYVGGAMAWPVPGYTRITSPFGMRTHPITGVYKLHTGVDIGAPYGSTFIAANDGIVTYAGWNNAYGNMVIVSHGGGITTLYAHGSEILVQVGDQITQGTPVLKVGSTGYSTGPHAHFEVRINGEYVEPLDFITSYSSNSNNQSNISNNTVNNVVNNIVDNENAVTNSTENNTLVQEIEETEENERLEE